jgi:hypothetical protein
MARIILENGITHVIHLATLLSGAQQAAAATQHNTARAAERWLRLARPRAGPARGVPRRCVHERGHGVKCTHASLL